MPRRPTNNATQIPRITGARPNDAWAMFVCVKCSAINLVSIGDKLLSEQDAYDNAEWACDQCGFVHSRQSGLPADGVNKRALPFANWSEDYILPGSLSIERFWRAFFRSAVSDKSAYWKQCNTCGRVLPSLSFARHIGWGPLEKQMECKSCKAVINTRLNPLRTKQQLHESAVKRRAAELLLAGENEAVDLDQLFVRFGGKCFKTGVPLDKADRSSWAVDHILPSRWLYPLNPRNAALLSSKVNGAKSDKWPGDFYTNEELIRLAQITGADLSLITQPKPVLNPHIDVNACVQRMLTVRSKTDLSRRVGDIRRLLDGYGLSEQLTETNKRILGYEI